MVYTRTGGGQAIFESNGGGIKSIVDGSKKDIPKDFIDSLRGWTSMKRFTHNGGLEKIFSSWDKLGANDKLIYSSLDWFNKKTLSSADLINQIKGNFQVDTSKVFVEGKHFLIQSDGGKKSFDMTLKGVNKMVAFLKKK